jgi:hypothetical protein
MAFHIRCDHRFFGLGCHVVNDVGQATEYATA